MCSLQSSGTPDEDGIDFGLIVFTACDMSANRILPLTCAEMSAFGGHTMDCLVMV